MVERTDSKLYLETIDRLEPDIHMIDPGAYYASAAISLKRIADGLDKLNSLIEGSPTSLGFIEHYFQMLRMKERDDHG